MTSANTPEAAGEVMCCGQDGPWSPPAGAPLGVSCQLCPNAAGRYWRRARADSQPYQSVQPLRDTGQTPA
jgi:hypothetical protein